MGVVKKAGMVPQTVNDDPTASLIAWGVPVSADRPSKIRLESETRDSLYNEIKAFPRLSLEAVERRLSVKLDKLIEKVDQLQADITPHSIGLIAYVLYSAWNWFRRAYDIVFFLIAFF
jgi:hypothetical protein